MFVWSLSLYNTNDLRCLSFYAKSQTCSFIVIEMNGGTDMLKGIPEILSPELLKVLCEMGHSDRLVIADGNFPVESMGKNAITIRCDGHGVPEILEAILKVFPLDTYVEHPVNLMEVMPGDDVETPIWDTYKEIIRKYDDRGDAVVGNIERFAFYDEAKTAYCIISTSEKALYANVMLQKGVVINN
jgi:L-fucose mutarotase